LEKGAEERNQCYGPMINELKKYFPEPFKNGERVSVLHPGIHTYSFIFERLWVRQAAFGISINGI